MYDLPKEELKTKSYSKLWVMTTNGDSYLFQDNSYHIRQDTLFGKSFNENKVLKPKTIPLKDIYAMQTERLNGGATVMLVLGTAVMIGVVGILLFVSAFNSAFKQN